MEPKRRGPKRKPPGTQKKGIYIKLPPWLLEFMDSRPESRPVLIEAAMVEKYGIGGRKL